MGTTRERSMPVFGGKIRNLSKSKPLGQHNQGRQIPSNRPASRRLKIMRWIDHWVGLPLCFMFGLCVKFCRMVFPKRKREISGERPVAVFKFFGMGTIIAATPLLKAIRKRYPNAPLIFVTFDTNRSLLEMLGHDINIKIIRTNSILFFLTDVLGTIFSFHKRRVEAIVDLEFFSKFSTLLSFLCWAPIRIGYHLNDFWRYSLITHPIYFNYFVHLTSRVKNMSATSRLESLYSVINKKQNERQDDSSSLLLLQQYMELVRITINAKEIE